MIQHRSMSLYQPSIMSGITVDVHTMRDSITYNAQIVNVKFYHFKTVFFTINMWGESRFPGKIHLDRQVLMTVKLCSIKVNSSLKIAIGARSEAQFQNSRLPIPRFSMAVGRANEWNSVIYAMHEGQSLIHPLSASETCEKSLTFNGCIIIVSYGCKNCAESDPWQLQRLPQEW